METLTHVSGDVLRLEGGRVIQRCWICGAKLIDNLNEAAPTLPDGSARETAIWPTGRLVQETIGQNPKRYLLLQDVGGKLPEDSCLALVEAE